MRKFLFAVLVAFLGFAPAHADKMVNVEYIHKLIEQRWDISIPYSPKLSTPKVAANMKYLLTLVDMTNKRINGVETTHYGDGEFATMAAADTIAANRAITKLARIKPKFTITTTPDTTEFTFNMTAAGRFMVDWGDNSATQIVRDKVTELTPYTHTYKKPGEYKIKMTGRATGYEATDSMRAAISFDGNKNIAKISGSLGAIFPSLGKGASFSLKPGFFGTFNDCTNMTSEIPADLFAGISGAPRQHMFANTFKGCTNLSGSIPAGLFSHLSGEPASSMFESTFQGCRNLSGSIPEKLFTTISGNPAPYLFYSTFNGCGKLSGPIPEKLFATISGPAERYLFQSTFQGCHGLSESIPAKLFENISGQPRLGTFNATFRDCTNLTGPIPAGLFAGISGNPDNYMFAYTFYNCSGLTGAIPADLFGDIYGPPADFMFSGTFLGCSGLTGEIPAGLFGKLAGTMADKAFYNTFVGCTGLTGCIPDDLFGEGLNVSEVISKEVPFSGTSGMTFTACSALAPKFTVTTTADTSEFKFDMSAQGLFKIDWGDGKSQIVNRTDTTNATYSHEYDTPGEYKIGIGGYATGYSTTDNVAAIRFGSRDFYEDANTTVAKIDGSLGAIFSTIGDGDAPGQQPSFSSIFLKCHKLGGTIPENLFTGVHGAPISNMYLRTFYDCHNLTGEIPDKLFGDLAGAPTKSLFEGAFLGCYNLTGPIPANLFGKISGTPAKNMFFGTFYNCYKLDGEIPANLFAGIKGEPAEYMFGETFRGCNNLTGPIPANLFGKISGTPAKNMFHWAFYDCTKLTGCVPDGLFGDVGMTLDEIIAEYAPFNNATKITPEYCPVDNSAATE